MNKVIVVAILTASIWETAKTVYDSKDGLQINKLGAIAVGIILAMNFNIDIFTTVGVTGAYPVLSKLFTGVLIGNGSNFIYDIYASVHNIKEDLEEK